MRRLVGRAAQTIFHKHLIDIPMIDHSRQIYLLMVFFLLILFKTTCCLILSYLTLQLVLPIQNEWNFLKFWMFIHEILFGLRFFKLASSILIVHHFVLAVKIATTNLINTWIENISFFVTYYKKKPYKWL